MKKKNALLLGFFSVVAVVSSVALFAKFYMKPTKTMPMYREEFKLTEQEWKELEAAEQKVLENLEKEAQKGPVTEEMEIEEESVTE